MSPAARRLRLPAAGRTPKPRPGPLLAATPTSRRGPVWPRENGPSPGRHLHRGEPNPRNRGAHGVGRAAGACSLGGAGIESVVPVAVGLALGLFLTRAATLSLGGELAIRPDPLRSRGPNTCRRLSARSGRRCELLPYPAGLPGRSHHRAPLRVVAAELVPNSSTRFHAARLVG
jgi:hypothetical protein